MREYDIEDSLIHFNGFCTAYIEFGCYVQEHTHNALELVYTVFGHGEHIIDNNKLKAKRGTLIVMDYNCVHKIQSWETMKYYNVMFNAGFLTDKIDKMSRLRELMKEHFGFELSKGYMCVEFQDEETIKKVEELFFEMLEEGMQKRDRYIPITQCHLNEVINLMLRSSCAEERNPDDIVLMKAMDYVRSHSDSALKLEEVADRFNHKPEYFSQRLKEYCGMSFKQLLISKRLNDVVDDLMETDDSINEIIVRHGFTNKTYFYNVFEKNYGVKPKFIREYRNNYLRYIELKTKYKTKLTEFQNKI